MSSIVSRRPPFSVSTSQEKDFFWMSIRLGTSRTLSRRAKLRRVRGASTAAKTATPQGDRGRQERGRGCCRGNQKARPAKIAQGEPDPCEGRSALTDPVRHGPYVAGQHHFGRLRLSADWGGSVARGSSAAGGQRAPDEGFACQALAPRAPASCRRELGRVPSATLDLLDLHPGAGLLEFRLELVGLLAVDALLDGLGRLVDERLGLLEAEAGRRADDLDDLDLLVAGAGEDHVERGLLLGLRAVAVGAGGSRAGRGGGGDRRRRDAELLLERLDALGELEHGDRLQLVDPLLGAAGHGYSFSLSVSPAESSSAGAVSGAGSGSGPGSEGSDAGPASGSSGGEASAAGAASAVSAAISGVSPARRVAPSATLEPTRPCSAICESWRASPPIRPFRLDARPVSGDATMPTRRP